MTSSFSPSLSSRNLNYFQELCSMFPDKDPMMIKSVILHFQDWDKITSAILNPNQPEVQETIQKSMVYNHSKSEDPKRSPFLFSNDQSFDSLMQKKRISSENIGINTNPTRYSNSPQTSESSQSCLLFLPDSIVDIPIDFDHFGDF